RNSDLGFLTSRPDKNDVSGGFSLVQPDVWKAFRYVEWYNGAGRQWNRNGDVFGANLTSNVFARTRQFWILNGGYTHLPAKLDDLDTRGGPPIARSAGHSFFANVTSDTRKTWGLNLNTSGFGDKSGA